jgi:preprotein translocase subunit SecA
MLTAGDRARAQKAPEDIVELIEQRAREAYARREIEYPIDYVMTYAAGGPDGGDLDNPYAAEHVRQWALRKYHLDLPIEQIRSTPVRKLRELFLEQQRQYLASDKLTQEVDAVVASANGDLTALTKAANEHYDLRLAAADLEPAALNARAREDAEADDTYDAKDPPTLTLRDFLRRRARQFYRRELTDLEQFVLIQIFDTAWKDHLYAMDMLKSGIGLHSFAERDPRILYKKEGFQFFQQMMAGIRDKVTDLIFRFQIAGPTQARSNYRETAAVHEDTGGYGVAENIRATAGAIEPPGQAGGDGDDGSGGTATKVKTIVNEGPKVGRNDPCPCGSGKKYKKCHGAHLA